MAKTAPKKTKAPASIHSRAAKRASSPGIDLDKSLKDVKPPPDVRDIRPSVLAIHQGAGISKKSKNGRKAVLSAKASRRKEKGMDRAEAFMDKKDKKVEKSKGRARNVQDRSKAWEEQNKKALAMLKAAEEADQEGWVDEDMEEDPKPVVKKKTLGTADVELTDAAAMPLPEDEDEIL